MRRCLPLLAVVIACGGDGGANGSVDAGPDAMLGPGSFGLSDISDMSPDLAESVYGGEAGWDRSDKYAPGVALVDLDGDDVLDIVQPRNERSDASLRPLRMYRGLGDGRFEDVTTVVWDDSRNAMAALAFDYDGDDDLDVFVGVDGGPSVLYRNDGDWQFTDVAASAGVAMAGERAYAAAAGDIDADGDLDLYVGKFNADAPDHGPGTAPNVLFVNQGDGTFVDGTDAAGVACDGRSTLGLAIADLDGDGDQDIYVANDFFEDCVYENRGDGTFDEVASSAGVTDAASRGMGVAVGDLDGDMDLDVMVTDTENIDASRGNAMFMNRGDGDLAFDSVAMELGLDGITTLQADWLVSWGVGFVDFDVDGDLDIHIATHIERQELVYRNDGGAYTPLWDVINGIGTPDARGSAYGDIDGDGDVDIVIGRRGGEGLQVLRNDSEGGRSITVAVRPYAAAPGALITFRSPSGEQLGVIQAGQGYMSTSPPSITFGLGNDAAADEIEVRFADGRITTVSDVEGGTTVVVRPE
jgi:hypothetical protein